MDYLLLGTMTVTADGQVLNLGGFRQRAVLAALLLSADRTVDVDALTEQVWGASPPPKPVASLRAYVANLRRILADDVRRDRVVTDGRGYRLRLGSDRLDTRLFEAQVGQGKRLPDTGDPAGAAATLAPALALWRGSPLADFRELPFADHEVHRLKALRSDAVETRYEAELLNGRGAELIGGLESEVAADPLRERLWAQLMLALYRAGRRTDALTAYQRLQVILDDELGVRPGLSLERLAAQIRDESTDLDWTGSRALFAVTDRRGVGKTALTTQMTRLAADLRRAPAESLSPAATFEYLDAIRILLPMYYLLLADVEIANGRFDAARDAVDAAESIAATGERVWDGQLAARREKLRAAGSRADQITA